MSSKTINECVQNFLKNIHETRSANTERTYSHAMKAFVDMLGEKEISPDDPVTRLSEKDISDFAQYLKYYATSTESLYINTLKNFYEFLAAEEDLKLNLYETRLLIKKRTRKPGVRLPQFPKNDIMRVLEYAEKLPTLAAETELDRLILLRDSAFLITLADTGLRIHEACGLERGMIDWFEGKAVIIGKGNKQAVIRFSKRSIIAMRNYLNARGALDGATGKKLASLPVFARHDKGAGKSVLPITTKTGRQIVKERVRECLGDEAAETITPHSFRHYFVTNVLQKTGNLKIAQEFARHASVTVTQRYAHLVDSELDQTYDNIFNND